MDKTHQKSFPLTKCIYEQINSSSCLYTNIQFLPQCLSIQAVEDSENDTLEIGFSKKLYLQIFTEGHSYFNGNYPTTGEILSMDESGLQHTYLASLALLLTTNEYTTIWRVHEHVVWELARRYGEIWAQKDFSFCIALATSRLDKINKSSPLWHWLRKLSILFVFREFEPGKFSWLMEQVLRSMEAHLANYAAGFTLIWLVQVARNSGFCIDERLVISLVREKCRQKLGDISMWTCFGRLLSLDPAPYAVSSYRILSDELEQMKVMSPTKVNLHLVESEPAMKHTNSGDTEKKSSEKFVSIGIQERTETEVDLQSEALTEIKWLLDIRCTKLSPYIHILQGIESKNRVKDLMRAESGSLSISSARSEQESQFYTTIAQVLDKLEG